MSWIIVGRRSSFSLIGDVVDDGSDWNKAERRGAEQARRSTWLSWQMIRMNERVSSLQAGPTNWHHFLHALTLPNINRFSKLFHCQSQEKICNNNTITKDPTTHQVCRYTTLWNVFLVKATIENKTTSVTTHLKKLTTRKACLLSQLLSKVTVTSCSLYIKCSVCPPCCGMTHSSRRR